MSKGKGGEILRLGNVSAKSRHRILLAIAGPPPTELLNRNGWDTTDAVAATIDAEAYRQFIQASWAELGFAKSMYVETRSGWFSDRTQCYLATGRPAVVLDTGFGDVIPCGEGLFGFSGEEDLLAAMEAIGEDYAGHSRRARAIVEEYFAAEKVLCSALERAKLA